ncbi:Na(+)/H(+) antiporter subunit F [wastewater metagenome]|uniref:Na(+)/H(+) antiporter subunit F n=2 Tax=unclassified sequences TaxID=12908 RepID=A0A5B8R5Z6_9ZZZZ|nr:MULTISPECIES: K+/H+ antiporter subunit F [Arhodomonas]MCS4505738.1 K+/H+ antiporter subunit F [Arhodomonas aquaeolei]QEA04329.1 Na(+)/H(+) antiporter subunit F [uncultured organism]
MLTVTLYIGFAAVIAAMAMNLYRLLAGPTAEDRVLALDTLYINAIALILLVSIQFADRIYFEAALLIAMMGFVGTIALAKYLGRGALMD